MSFNDKSESFSPKKNSGDFLNVSQFRTLGKKCSLCEQTAKWVAHPDWPAYCDEHFPYNNFQVQQRFGK